MAKKSLSKNAAETVSLKKVPSRLHRLTNGTSSFESLAKKGDKVAVLKQFESKQMDDEFQEYYGSGNIVYGQGRVIQPPFNYYTLMKMPLENNTLRQCIDAMVTNIDGNGYRLEFIGKEGEESSEEAKKERDLLTAFITNINDEYGFTILRKRSRQDYESIGNRTWEIIRAANGKISRIYHLPAHTIRMTLKDKEATLIEKKVPDGAGGETTIRIRKHFRRYVQLVGDKLRFFKEFGDTRTINPDTGQIDNTLSFQDGATEVYHSCIYTAGTPYGLPRWFHQLPSIMGSREAELTNLDFFQENAIPAMAVLVSGGFITEESIQVLEDNFQRKRGRKNMNRVAIIEATSDIQSAGDDGRLPTPRVELKPLQDDRQGDALFQQYDKNNAGKVRSAFRLPPLYLGDSSDYTKATAYVSMTIAESQVFGPERKDFDEFFNREILSQFAPKYWKFRTLPPRVGGRDEIIQAIHTLTKVGAITPNDAVDVANDLLDLDLTPFDKPWANYPLPITTMLANKGKLKGIEDIYDPQLGEKDPVVGAQSDPMFGKDGAQPSEALPPNMSGSLGTGGGNPDGGSKQ